MIRRLVIPLMFFALCFSVGDYPAQADNSAPTKGKVLASAKLPAPRSPQEKAYLGLSSQDRFRMPDIKAEIVIAEVFSMYCPHCQKAAPRVNEFYRLIENNPQLRDKVKLIGIGVGNSAYEVEVFKKKYDIPFPLFPDGEYAIHDAMGGVRTPHFVAIRNFKDGTYKVFYSQVGGFEKADEFLERMLKLSESKEGN